MSPRWPKSFRSILRPVIEPGEEMSRHPHHYPRRILLAVCGLTPQIATETLYALAVLRRSAFIPTEIRILTTREGAHRARLTLLHPVTGKFHQLRRDYGLPEIVFDETSIHVITDTQGQELDDIRTPEDNEQSADAITHHVRQLTADPETALHVSIAGGRKTMGYYAGYALSLFGREQDRLSHVLVQPEYESHPDFFYPTRASHIIHTREGRPIDAREAAIALAEIPFIRLRTDIPQALLEGRAGFSETISMAAKAAQAPVLRMEAATGALYANDIPLQLPAILLAFYRWVLKRTLLEEQSLVKPNKDEFNAEYAAEFLAIYRDVTGEARDIEKTEKALLHGMEERFFLEKISRINKTLKTQLGARLSQAYCIKNRGGRLNTDYGVELRREQIHF